MRNNNDDSSSSVAISTEELFNCPQCKSTYNDPRLLPCEHTLCLACVEQVQNSKELKDRVCPVDKTPLPVNLKPQDLPQNHLCAALTTLLTKTTSPTSQHANCTNCDEEKTVASLWCESCGDLCETCSKTLHSMKSLKNHSVITLQEKNQDAAAIVPKCSTHDENKIDLYCPQCKVLACYICVANSHSTHGCILVPEAAKSFKEALKSNLITFLKKKTMLQRLIADKREEIKANEVRKTQLLAEVTNIDKRKEVLSKEIESSIQQFNQSETIYNTLFKVINDKSDVDILNRRVFEETKFLVGSVYKAVYQEDMVYKN